MIYYNFKNYEEFKQLFGIIEHGNGVKSRKNKILLALYKDRSALKRHIKHLEHLSAAEMYYRAATRCRRSRDYASWDPRYKNHRRWRNIARMYDLMNDRLCLNPGALYDLLDCTDLPSLKGCLFKNLTDIAYRKSGCHRNLHLMKREYFSDKFETDHFEGLCEDGTCNAIRYRSLEKGQVFKMKAGKMFNHILSCCTLMDDMPEQIKRWLSEEFVADWIQYVTEETRKGEYTLHVDDNFGAIYSSERCLGYDEDSDCFGSCMVDDYQHHFYEESVQAKAAYLTDCNDMIVARCILFTDVYDEEGNRWRLAERQYSYESDLAIQRQLIGMLIRDGHIDGYKRVGASCHDNQAFVDNEGNSLSDKKFRIRCTIEYGDTLSYQDSFRWLDKDEHVAYNYQPFSEMVDLADTSSELERPDWDKDHSDECWSDYHDCYIPECEAEYVESREDYFYDNEVVDAHMWNSGNDSHYLNTERCFMEDCLQIGGQYYYAGEDCEDCEENGIRRCAYCGEYITVDNCLESELTESRYCCWFCRKCGEAGYHRRRGDVFSGFEDKWLSRDDAVEVYVWIDGFVGNDIFGYEYKSDFVSDEKFDELIVKKNATYHNGMAFIDDIGFDGQPVHLSQLSDLYLSVNVDAA